MKKTQKIEFNIAAYREDYKGKSFKDLKAALSKKDHGKYICILGSGENRQLVFSRRKAYLYSDHINLYKKLPRKFIYVEAAAEGYLLVSILNGKVFFESNVISSDALFKQIEVFENLNSEALVLNIYAPEQKKLFSKQFAEIEKVDLEFLDKPISASLTPNKNYLTFDPLLKQRLKLYKISGLLLFVLAIGAGLAYNQYQVRQQKEEALEAQQKAAQHVDHYIAYKNEFRKNSARLILNNFTKDYEILAPAIKSGWSVLKIDYNGNALTFTLGSKTNLLEPLNSLATEYPKINLQYGNSFNDGNVIMNFPMSNEIHEIPTVIVPVKPELIKFTDQLSLTFKNAVTYTETSFSNKDSYSAAELSVNLNNIGLIGLTTFITNVDFYPAKITSLSIKPGRALINPTFSMTSKIQFYGSN